MGNNFSLPYTVNEKGENIKAGFWNLKSGNKNDTGEEVSIFIFDEGKSSRNYKRASDFLENIKSLRHPNILKYYDSLTEDSRIIIVTEPVKVVKFDDISLNHKNTDILSVGISQICEALVFLNNSCNKYHINLVENSILVAKNGDWKLGGFEFTFSPLNQPNDDVIDHLKWKFLNSPYRNLPKEIYQAEFPHYILDCWNLAIFIYQCFGRKFYDFKDFKKITNYLPETLLIPFKKLISTNAQQNAISSFKNSPFFDNPFSNKMRFISNINLKSKQQKERFLRSFSKEINHFPFNVKMHKILPVLLELIFQDFESNEDLLFCVINIGNSLSQEEYKKKITPVILKLFDCKVRKTRLILLKNFENIVAKIDLDTLEKKIFPLYSQGFLDSFPMTRTVTLKQSVFIASKLSENGFQKLIFYLFKLQYDLESSIRYNSISKISELADSIPSKCHDKILLKSIETSLRDQTISSMCGGLYCLHKHVNSFDIKFVAKNLLHCVGPFAISKDKDVRSLAIDCLEKIVYRIEAFSSMEKKKEPSLSAKSMAAINKLNKTFSGETHARIPERNKVTKPKTKQKKKPKTRREIQSNGKPNVSKNHGDIKRNPKEDNFGDLIENFGWDLNFREHPQNVNVGEKCVSPKSKSDMIDSNDMREDDFMDLLDIKMSPDFGSIFDNKKSSSDKEGEKVSEKEDFDFDFFE